MTEGARGGHNDQDTITGSVTLVGTAHVSQSSVDEVESTIEAESPDIVAVELDEGRYRQLAGETPDDLDAADLLHGNTVFQFLAYWLLSYVQTQLGERFDVTPGADMMAAVETAEAVGSDVALVDRDIQVTIQRFWARLSLAEKVQLFGTLTLGLADPLPVGVGVGAAAGLIGGFVIEAVAGPVVVPASTASPLFVGLLDGLVLVAMLTMLVGGTVATVLLSASPDADGQVPVEMDALTDTDVVSAMIEEFRRVSPGGATALIDERDAYIAARLAALRAQGAAVVAVVGAGHRPGIERYLEAPATIPATEPLEQRVSGGRVSAYKLVGYLITAGFVGFFLLVAMAGVQQRLLLELLASWFLVNFVFSFGLAAIAGARWTSALVGGAVAWITSVNPVLAPGWFAGYAELRHTEVNVGDIGTLNELLQDETMPIVEIVRGMLDVPLFKLIAIVAVTNIGSFLASLLFVTLLAPALFAGQGIDSASDVAGLMLAGANNSLDLLLGALAR